VRRYPAASPLLQVPHKGYRFHLPRSRHLPVAVVDGSLIKNVNKTGVRLWTDYSRSRVDDGRLAAIHCRRQSVLVHARRLIRSDARLTVLQLSHL
jgi:hypothetical protein